MKVLLDHCIPRPFERALSDHEAVHTSRLRWGGLKNGMLLGAAEAEGFGVMITVDRSLRFQQNMKGRRLAVIVLRVPKNDIDTLTDMAEAICAQLAALRPGAVVTLSHPRME